MGSNQNKSDKYRCCCIKMSSDTLSPIIEQNNVENEEYKNEYMILDEQSPDAKIETKNISEPTPTNNISNVPIMNKLFKLIKSNKSNNLNNLKIEITGNNLVKILLVGPARSGKTCFKNVLTNNFTECVYDSSDKFDYVQITHIMDKISNEVQIWDTPGDLLYLNNLKYHLKYFDCICFIYGYDNNLSSVNAFEKFIAQSLDLGNDISWHNNSRRPFKLFIYNNEQRIEMKKIGDHYIANLKLFNDVASILRDLVIMAVSKNKTIV
jgi:hypothetical protein